MADDLPPSGSRIEDLLHRQIALQEETNRLLGDIKKRLPFWPTLQDFRDIVNKAAD